MVAGVLYVEFTRILYVTDYHLYYLLTALFCWDNDYCMSAMYTHIHIHIHTHIHTHTYTQHTHTETDRQTQMHTQTHTNNTHRHTQAHRDR